MLPLPAASVNLFAPTSMVAAPPAVGVNVAVYEVPLPEKPLKAPLVTVTSPSTKSVVDSLDVKVKVKVASLVVEPLLTALLPSVAVMVMAVAVLSSVYVMAVVPEAVPSDAVTVMVPVPTALGVIVSVPGVSLPD